MSSVEEYLIKLLQDELIDRFTETKNIQDKETKSRWTSYKKQQQPWGKGQPLSNEEVLSKKSSLHNAHVKPSIVQLSHHDTIWRMTSDWRQEGNRAAFSKMLNSTGKVGLEDDSKTARNQVVWNGVPMPESGSDDVPSHHFALAWPDDGQCWWARCIWGTRLAGGQWTAERRQVHPCMPRTSMNRNLGVLHLPPGQQQSVILFSTFNQVAFWYTLIL